MKETTSQCFQSQIGPRESRIEQVLLQVPRASLLHHRTRTIQSLHHFPPRLRVEVPVILAKLILDVRLRLVHLKRVHTLIGLPPTPNSLNLILKLFHLLLGPPRRQNLHPDLLLARVRVPRSTANDSAVEYRRGVGRSH